MTSGGHCANKSSWCPENQNSVTGVRKHPISLDLKDAKEKHTKVWPEKYSQQREQQRSGMGRGGRKVCLVPRMRILFRHSLQF